MKFKPDERADAQCEQNENNDNCCRVHDVSSSRRAQHKKFALLRSVACELKSVNPDGQSARFRAWCGSVIADGSTRRGASRRSGDKAERSCLRIYAEVK